MHASCYCIETSDSSPQQLTGKQLAYFHCKELQAAWSSEQLVEPVLLEPVLVTCHLFLSICSLNLIPDMWVICRENASFKIFVVVIPKEGLAGRGPANPSFDMTPTMQYILRRLQITNLQRLFIHIHDLGITEYIESIEHIEYIEHIETRNS